MSFKYDLEWEPQPMPLPPDFQVNSCNKMYKYTIIAEQTQGNAISYHAQRKFYRTRTDAKLAAEDIAKTTGFKGRMLVVEVVMTVAPTANCVVEVF